LNGLKASVIIPAYNEENSIKECILALQNQTRKPFEIILADDGSFDNTVEIAETFSEIKILKQKNRGPAVARNCGAKIAKGEIIVFIDADCVAEKNWLEEMLKPFESREIAGVQGRYKTNQKELIARFSQIEIEERYERLSKEKYIDFIGSYSAAYRKGVFEKFNGFDEKFPVASGEDPDLSFRIAEKGYKLVFNPNAIVYHTHQTSLAKYLKTKFFRAYWRILLYKKHPEKMAKDSYTPQTLKAEIACLIMAILAGILGIFFSIKELFLVSEALIILIFILNLKFLLFAIKKDWQIALLSLVVIPLRTISFSLGLAAGILSGVAQK